jgi:hypothetical protein
MVGRADKVKIFYPYTHETSKMKSSDFFKSIVFLNEVENFDPVERELKFQFSFWYI